MEAVKLIFTDNRDSAVDKTGVKWEEIEMNNKWLIISSEFYCNARIIEVLLNFQILLMSA